MIAIGGVCFKAKAPAAQAAWYHDHLGLDLAGWNGATFPWGGEGSMPGMAIRSPFATDTTGVTPDTASLMVDVHIADLDALLPVRAGGCDVVDRTETSGQGIFGRVVDQEGNTLELWQPPPAQWHPPWSNQ